MIETGHEKFNCGPLSDKRTISEPWLANQKKWNDDMIETGHEKFNCGPLSDKRTISEPWLANQQRKKWTDDRNRS
jgi:hypothetical protein